ncbi:MAG: hemerythrin family protein [Terracidiphilus sp.]|jgi:hemerythrin-like metal-binding protein
MNAIGEIFHPRVGVKLLDRDHDNLSGILGEIQFRAAAGLGGARTVEMVRRLAQHMRLHFALEEGMMTTTQYPGTNIHHLQHRLLIDQVNMLATQRGRNALERNIELLNLLTASHSGHIAHADLDYGLWLQITKPHLVNAD